MQTKQQNVHEFEHRSNAHYHHHTIASIVIYTNFHWVSCFNLKTDYILCCDKWILSHDKCAVIHFQLWMVTFLYPNVGKYRNYEKKNLKFICTFRKIVQTKRKFSDLSINRRGMKLINFLFVWGKLFFLK